MLFYTTKRHDIETCVGVKVQLCAVLTYALGGCTSLRFTTQPLNSMARVPDIE
jgi:hypothetical protein